MEPLKIATVQFETRDNDKVYNLSIIREMCRKASVEGADVVKTFTNARFVDIRLPGLLARNCWLLPNRSPRGVRKPLIAIAKEFGVTLLGRIL